MKQKLVIVGRHPRLTSWANFPHFRNILNEYFQFEDYDRTVRYDARTWFVILAESYLEVKDQFKDRKVIVDVCCEANMHSWDRIQQQKIPHHVVMYGSVPVTAQPGVLYVPNFFWFNEALSQPREFVADFNYSKKFLMPIGRKTQWRDYVVESLTMYLDDAYWSYVRRGRALPGEPDSVPGAKRWDTRYENPIWYNDTCFSLVLESVTAWDQCVPFLTEKIYKPIRHCHPYMVVGAPGILKHLRCQGFETFGHLFDESYDQTQDLSTKLKIIANNVESFSKQPFDKTTLDKGLHNQELFYNQQVICQGIKKSIAEPVLELLETI